jgi:hypothetical protein
VSELKIKQNSGTKNPLKSNKKYSWKSLQPTGTSERQNFRAQI